MATRFRSGWWAARSTREKRLLLALGAILMFVLVWLLMIRPILDARAAAEARLTAAVTDLGKARAEAAALKQVATGSINAAPVPLPLDGYLMTAGAEAGFTTAQVVADGASRATISLANVRPQAWFAWLTQLEARGIVVESMSARANADQTIAVDAVLTARAQQGGTR